MEADLIDHRYRVVRRLGQGGMGRVYQVVDELEAGRVLALKTLIPGEDTGLHETYLRHEFRVLASLEHPHLVRLHDFGRLEGEGRCYFTMDYVEGVDLRAAAHGASCERVAALALQVCEALDFIHERGVLHQDLKPANVLVALSAARPATAATPGPWARIVDFGLSSGVEGPHEGAIHGTPHYLAPELIRGEPHDPRTDLYALGVTLYEVLTGRPPLDGDTIRAIVRAHLEVEPAPPSTLRPEIPGPLEDLVLALLAKDPARRPYGADEVARELHRLLGTEPPSRSRASRRAWRRSGRLVGRDEALQDLASALESAVHPGGRGPAVRVVLLEGGPGLGKSRLLRELRPRAQLSGAAWCEGGARGARAGAFGAFLPALRLAVSALPAAPLAGGPSQADLDAGLDLPARLAGGERRHHRVRPGPGADPLATYGPWLGRLLPVAGAAGGRPTPEAGFSQTFDLTADPRGSATLVEALAGFLAEVARRCPLVLVLEDLHAADAASSRLALALARRLALPPEAAGPGPAPRGLLLLTVDPDRLDEALGRDLDAVLEGPATRRVVLAPLEEAQVAELVRSMMPVGERDAARVAAAVGGALGNPLLVGELVAALAEGGALVPQGGEWTLNARRLDGLPVAETAERLLEGRLSGLGAAALGVARALAEADAPLDLDSVAAASGLDPEALHAAVVDLTHARLLRREGPRTLGLAHGLVGRVVRAGTAAPERVRIHRALLGILVARRGRSTCTPEDPDAEALAHHALQANRPRRAVPYATAAARRCRRLHAPEQALRFARSALDLLDPADHEGRAALEEVCVGAEVALGRPPQAEAAALRMESHALAREGPPGGTAVARARLQLGRVRHARGDLKAALAFYREAALLLEAGRDPFLLGRALWLAGAVEQELGHPAEAIPELGRALGLLEGPEARAARGGCLNSLAIALMATGEIDPALDRFQVALGLAEEGGDRRLSAGILGNMGALWFFRGEFARALDAFRRALEVMEALGDREGAAHVLEGAGLACRKLGDGPGMLDALERSLALRLAQGDPAGEARTRLHLGQARLLAGDPARAADHLARAEALARETGRGRLHAEVLLALGGLHEQRGAYAEALEANAEVLRLGGDAAHPAPAGMAHLNRAQLLLVLGRVEEAAAELETSARHAASSGYRVLQVLVQVCEGRVEQARGRPTRALERLESAREAARGLGAADVLAEAELALAQALLATGPSPAFARAVDRLERLDGPLGWDLRVETARLRAEALRARGQGDRALQLLRSVQGRARPGQAHPEVCWRLYWTLGLVQADLGRPAEAAWAHGEALRLVEDLARGLPEALRASYLETQDRRGLRDATARAALHVVEPVRRVGPGDTMPPNALSLR
ncbi:MAG: protein kinase [Planctomycetes bacterium]|nr:protein kinase [Planctomycetota bacterium]